MYIYTFTKFIVYDSFNRLSAQNSKCRYIYVSEQRPLVDASAEIPPNIKYNILHGGTTE